MRDYECYICVNKPLVADIMSSWPSEARVNLTLFPAAFFSPTSTCPPSCALWPRAASLSRRASHSLERGLGGSYTEILSMCQLLLRQTQNRRLTAPRMCVCLAKMWTEEWQDHPVLEVTHKGGQTTRNRAVLRPVYGGSPGILFALYRTVFLVKT